MNRILSVSLIIIASLLSVNVSAQLAERQAYVTKYKCWAIKEMLRTGIPASITLAQGILESDCGRSMLATEANNHFGIKCHNDWTGKTMYKDDDRKQECFRSYDNAYDSFKDHSDFLVTKQRYSKLFKLDPTDYEGWAAGLKECGYATEPTYAYRLVKIIEEEGLAQYDNATSCSDDEPETLVVDNTTKGGNKSNNRGKGRGELSNQTDDYSNNSSNGSSTVVRKKSPKVKAVFSIEPFVSHEVLYNNGVRYIMVGSADTFESIATEFQMMVWELYKYNDLALGADIKGITYLYLRPKRNKAHRDCTYHVVEEGDTMWSISQKYGVKYRKLLNRNGMTEGQEPSLGTEILLR